jgi:hypothetical protein
MRVGFAAGLGLGLAAAAAGCALSQTRERFDEGDHYAMSWTVLAGGQVVCTDPFVRPGEREIECRSARGK